MTVTFACGHTLALGDNPSGTPVCGCGNQQIARTHARAPRFTGTCSGPYAEFRNLAPTTVNLAPAGPLKLTPPKKD